MPMKSPTTISPPAGVTLIACGVLTIAGFHLIRCLQAALQWRFLATLLPGLPLYQGLSGLFWAAARLPLAWGLWRGAPWAARWMRRATVIYVLYYWLDRLILRTGLEHADLPFTLILTILLASFVLWGLSTTQFRLHFLERKA